VRVIFAGSRHGRPIHELHCAIVCSELLITEVVHGGAQGVDAQADAWARYADIPVTIFRADWKHLLKAAGPIRNRAMAEYADAMIALDGGDGTGDMIRQAGKHGLPVYVQPPVTRCPYCGESIERIKTSMLTHFAQTCDGIATAITNSGLRVVGVQRQREREGIWGRWTVRGALA
jgi:YspA, cpYpsA-related SLOG family